MQWRLDDTADTVNMKFKNIIVQVPLTESQGKKQIKVVFKPKHLLISVAGKVIIDSELEKPIKVRSFRRVSEPRMLHAVLTCVLRRGSGGELLVDD